jgi:MerR family transcriptional regulator, copper efflux regulator
MRRQTLRIGEVARQAAVNVQTVRYYERRGLLKEPERRESGYRDYDPEAVRLLRFIKQAQELGFTLKEVEELLALRADKRRSCAEVRQAAAAKIADVDRKISSLTAIREGLSVLLNSCTKDGSTRECPILEALENVNRKREPE